MIHFRLRQRHLFYFLMGPGWFAFQVISAQTIIIGFTRYNEEKIIFLLIQYMIIRTYVCLYQAIENTANQNTGKPLYIRRYYVQPSHHAPPVCPIHCVGHCIFYNNCLISRPLIGSFLSSMRVQMDKILIYASFQVQL